MREDDEGGRRGSEGGQCQLESKSRVGSRLEESSWIQYMFKDTHLELLPSSSSRYDSSDESFPDHVLDGSVPVFRVGDCVREKVSESQTMNWSL